jgi:hypothetical protein
MSEALSHERSQPPLDAEIQTLLGPAWTRYQAALKGLENMGLEPEYYWYDRGGGWTVRFQLNHVTGCAMYLGQSLIGLITVSSRVVAELDDNPQSDEHLLRLVLATRRKGTERWVRMPLRSQADVRGFLSLMQAKLDAQTPRAPVSHKLRPRTTPARSSRKTAGKSPRRSTALRSTPD